MMEIQLLDLPGAEEVKVLHDVFSGLRLPLSEYLQMAVCTNAYGHHPPPVLFLCQLNQVLEEFPSIHKTL